MDPNETLQMIDQFLTDRKAGEIVDEWSESLFQWIENGGSEPDWEKYQLGTSYYECHVIQRNKGI